MNSVASVKDRLKNRSRETGKTLQELLLVYGLERTIYRISISKKCRKFRFEGRHLPVCNVWRRIRQINYGH